MLKFEEESLRLLKFLSSAACKIIQLIQQAP